MSMMCLFLLTNSVGLKGKELQCFFLNDDFSDNSTIDQEYLFCTYSGEGFDHPNLLCIKV